VGNADATETGRHGARPLSGAARGALAALSGVLLFLSFPKFGHGLVAFVALAPLLLALPGTRGRRAFGLGWLCGAVSGCGLLYWTAQVVVQFGGLSWPVALVCLLLLSAAYGLFHGLFAWTTAAWCARFGLPGLLLAPVAWVATEVLRAYTFFRFPWCLLGYSQFEHLAVVQIASLTAVYGVSFVLVACSAALAYARLEREGRAPRRAIAGLGALLILVLGFGALRLASSAEPAGTPLRVGLVQASIAQDEKWDPAFAFDNIEAHVELTRAAAAQGARLVVWPESAVPFRYDDTPVVRRALDDLARALRVHLLFGNDDAEGDFGSQRFYVGAKLLGPDGALRLRYHKMRLVPFGEYVPLQPLLTLGGRHAARLVQQVADFTPGAEPVVGAAEGGTLGALICYEAIFPDLARRFTARGAGLLVNVTNDGWYGRSSAPYQHFAMAAFRAVENGVYVARAANTGISGVVDPHGRVLARTELFERRALVQDVVLGAPASGGRTFYARHGDVFAFACLALAAGLTLAGRQAPFRYTLRAKPTGRASRASRT
jgi:apolipoprotein N-acyltransferase